MITLRKGDIIKRRYCTEEIIVADMPFDPSSSDALEIWRPYDPPKDYKWHDDDRVMRHFERIWKRSYEE